MQHQVTAAEFSASIEKATSTVEFERITLDDIRRFLKRHALIIIASVILALSGAILYLNFSVPLYSARTQVIIDPSVSQLPRETREGTFSSIDSAQLESQLAILRSEKIATSVIRTLGLEELPEFRGPSTSASTADESPVEPGTLLRFQRQLGVRRVGISYAIDISFTSLNPKLAATVANAIAEAYIQDQILTKAEAARQGSRWLEERLEDLRHQMNAAALKAKEYRSKRDYRLVTEPNASSDSEDAIDRIANKARTRNTMEELEATAETYRKIYESYLSAFTEAVQRQSYPVSNARVITSATPPLRKSHPRTKLTLVLGAFFGFLVGLGIALVRHNLDRNIREARQLREEIGLEHLATIPKLPSRYSRSIFLRAFLKEKGHKDDLHAVVDTPLSAFSQGVKRLKAAISLINRTQQVRCIGIASALPNEGKTTLTANLGILFAKTDKRTLIIDCDVHNSRLSRALAPKSEIGLIEALNGTVDLADSIVRVEGTGVHILPVPVSDEFAYASELVSSEKMQELLHRLLETYDIIIVDIPPLAVVVDGLAISSMLDSVVLVAKWSATPAAALYEVTRALRNTRAKILGAVLNQVDPTSISNSQRHSQYLAYGS